MNLYGYGGGNTPLLIRLKSFEGDYVIRPTSVAPGLAFGTISDPGSILEVIQAGSGKVRLRTYKGDYITSLGYLAGVSTSLTIADNNKFTVQGNSKAEFQLKSNVNDYISQNEPGYPVTAVAGDPGNNFTVEFVLFEPL